MHAPQEEEGDHEAVEFLPKGEYMFGWEPLNLRPFVRKIILDIHVHT
jgi:hypothetical protein